MLTLTIVRHAKSSWDDASLKDFDRPLNDRGKAQTKQMGAYLQDHKINPDLILCSTARRAKQTLSRMMKTWQTDAEVVYDGRVYLASCERLKTLLAEYGKKPKHIMLVGHNPGLHLLAYGLAKKGNADSLKTLLEKFPTLAIASIRLETDKWKKIADGELELFITPKILAPA